MKRFQILPVFILLVVSCSISPTPISPTAPTVTDVLTQISASPTPTLSPTATQAPTETPIPTLEAFPGVPDPRITNPELFDLINPDSPIPQFVNAMKMADIEVNGEQVAQGITYLGLKYIDGNPFVVAAYDLDPDPAQAGETLEGLIPIAIAQKTKKGDLLWKKIRLRDLAIKTIGAVAHYPIYGDELHREKKLQEVLSNDFDGLILEAHLRWNGLEEEQGMFNQTKIEQVRQIIEFTNKNEQEIIGQHLFYYFVYPDWIKNNSFTPEEIKEILRNRAKSTIGQFPEIKTWIVVNEFHPTRWHPDELQTIALKNGITPKELLLMMFQSAQEVNPNATLLISDSWNETLDGGNYQRTLDYVRYLQENGINNIGVGVHHHLNATKSINFESMIKAIESYDVPVFITEADVNLKDIPASQLSRYIIQAEMYIKGVTACIKASNCMGYYTWDPGDNASWLEMAEWASGEWFSPIADATLFNDDLSPKPAYYAILQSYFSELINNYQE